jgi:hypothetical protein
MRTWLLLGLICGCIDSKGGDSDSDGDADSDSDTDAGTDGEPDCEPDPSAGAGTADVDLLFMVDNSNSMREEQANLTANFDGIVRPLVDPPDDDGDGEADWTAASSLHVGVISSDMGTSGYPVSSCDNPDRGSDGILQSLPRLEGCDATYPRFLTYDAAAPDPDLAQDFSCIASLGTGGCNFEQQLAAVEKALTVHAQPGAANDGFLRPDALLAVVVVTDEDDCTVASPEIFSDDDTLGSLNLRCFNNPELLRPTSDLVDALVGLKPDPDQIVFAAITGIPADLVPIDEAAFDSGDVQCGSIFDEILADPRMQEVVDDSVEGGGNRLVPACDSELGTATPARRIVEVVRDLDARGVGGLVQSICQPDWSPVARAIARTIQARIGG